MIKTVYEVEYYEEDGDELVLRSRYVWAEGPAIREAKAIDTQDAAPTVYLCSIDIGATMKTHLALLNGLRPKRVGLAWGQIPMFGAERPARMPKHVEEAA